MRTPLDPMRLVRWASGASVSSDLPISDPDPDPGLFGPDSLTWRLHAEQWLIAGGARSLLLQAAHPVVAQGALDHSRYAEDPFGRLYRTVQAMATLLFGTTHEVNAAARAINRLHLTVQGMLPATVGRHEAGAAYSAMDPSALLWVHAVFVDSILSAYQHFVAPLSAAERDQYWQESRRYAHLLGLTDAVLPASSAALQTYLHEAYISGEVAVGPGARTIARTILHPTLPWPRRPLWALVRLATVGQLPPDLRRDYGIRWTRAHEVGFGVLCATARLLRRAFPQLLGHSIIVNFAQRRVRGELLQAIAQAPQQPAHIETPVAPKR